MLIIKCKLDGSVEMIPTGYPGESCRQMTEHYSKRMALSKIKSDTPTAEANDTPPAQANAPARRKESQ